MRPASLGWLILLALTCALTLAAGSAVYGYHARQKIRDAYAVIARADSIQRNWISHGCAPLTKSLP